MCVKLLTEHHLGFLSLKGGCTGSSESTLVKMPYCWKSHVAVHIVPAQGFPVRKMLRAHAGVSRGARLPKFGLSLYLYPYGSYVRSKASAGLQIFFQDWWAEVTH